MRALLAGVSLLALSQASIAAVTSSRHSPQKPFLGPSTAARPNMSMCDFSIPTKFAHTWYIGGPNAQTEAAYAAEGVSLDPTVTPHQGDAQHPWDSVQAVFGQNSKSLHLTGYPFPLLSSAIGGTSASPIKPGDQILVNSGNYGGLNVGGFNYTVELGASTAAKLVIAPAPGQTPVLTSVVVGNTHDLVLTGLTIQSPNTSKTTARSLLLNVYPDNYGTTKNVIFDHLRISSAPDLATLLGWTQAQWLANVNGGVKFGISHCVSYQYSHEFGVYNGVVLYGALNSQLLDNEIDTLAGDGIIYTLNDQIIAGNYLHDWVNLNDDNHDDGMQGYGAPTNGPILIDSNRVIIQTRPFLFGPPAINGAIDITNDNFHDLTITNNVAVWLIGQAIQVQSCTNCLVAHNTVPLYGTGIKVTSSNYNVLVQGNLAANYYCADALPSRTAPAMHVQFTDNVAWPTGDGVDFMCINGGPEVETYELQASTYPNGNIVTGQTPAQIFTTFDPTNFNYDFHLQAGSAAIGAGGPPLGNDITGKPQNNPSDAGAYAY